MEEMLDDTLESLDEDEDLEEEADAEVDKVLYELTDGKLGVLDSGSVVPGLPVSLLFFSLPRFGLAKSCELWVSEDGADPSTVGLAFWALTDKGTCCFERGGRGEGDAEDAEGVAGFVEQLRLDRLHPLPTSLAGSRSASLLSWISLFRLDSDAFSSLFSRPISLHDPLARCLSFVLV